MTNARPDEPAGDDRPAGGSDSGDESAAAAVPRITQAMEDYLKGIYRLQQEAPEVSTQRLAEELAISGPSVTNMVKRLHDLRLVEHAPYHGVRLTPSGERIALEVIRHHRLLELYLAETLGFGWDQVHDEAERLEHHVSDELETRMEQALGYPTRDPHGDPIPGRDGAVADTPTVPLSTLDPGRRSTVVRVTDRDPALLRFLGEMGLRPGADVEVIERQPFDGPIRIRIDGAEHHLGPAVAGAVYVRGDGPPGS